MANVKLIVLKPKISLIGDSLSGEAVISTLAASDDDSSMQPIYEALNCATASAIIAKFNGRNISVFFDEEATLKPSSSISKLVGTKCSGEPGFVLTDSNHKQTILQGKLVLAEVDEDGNTTSCPFTEGEIQMLVNAGAIIPVVVNYKELSN